MGLVTGEMKGPFRGLVLFLFLSGVLVCSITFAGNPSPQVNEEVSHLLAYIEDSGCQFYRNGSWYDCHQARKHFELKYHHLCSVSRETSTEDVIECAGSRSSMSGNPYLVRCDARAPVTTGEWLRTELERFRLEGSKPQ